MTNRPRYLPRIILQNLQTGTRTRWFVDNDSPVTIKSDGTVRVVFANGNVWNPVSKYRLVAYLPANSTYEARY